ncbi:Flavoprotein [Penicillium malachiteum]|uniref:Flavoprotein n=1 Tax=Penicillium malachiteum TaxID=1324776 RepID=UPI002548CE11|nr:Flavoprotein [Penicillium malachiteum]KAJ5731797.1 Flavoprotein [Penicillium malachiteum]
MPSTDFSAVTENDIWNVKQAPFHYIKDDVKKPLEDDFMYEFKYDFPLPTHGDDVEFLDFTVEDEKDKQEIAGQLVNAIARSIQRGDSKAFAGLFVGNGIWGDKLVFTWDYRSFNIRSKIEKAASDLFSQTSVQHEKLIDPSPSIQRPYTDITWMQAVYSFDTDVASASAVMKIVKTGEGFKLWTLHTAMEEVPNPDGHMVVNKSWCDRRAEDNNLDGVEPDVVVVGGGHCGLHIAARLKALGITPLIVERNQRIGDNWRKRYEYLSLHLPHWGGSLLLLPFPVSEQREVLFGCKGILTAFFREHWPTYTPAGKMGDWLDWYAQALELPTWTDSNIVSTAQRENGEWDIKIQRGTNQNKYTRTFHPKHVILATSFAGVPFMPEIPGMEDFKGEIRHSTQHDSSREWERKKVLVVATSSSGFDTAFDFARCGIDVTLLQRSPTYVMSLDESVPRMIQPVYGPEGHKAPDMDTVDRIANGLPVGPAEEPFRRTAKDIWDADAEMIAKMEKACFQVWRGQRDTGQQTLAYTRNGGFYFDAGAFQAIIDGRIKVEQGYPVQFTENSLILNNNREVKYDLVILATRFKNAIESVRRIFGDDVARKCKPIWGIDEGELRCAWKETGVQNMWLMVGALQHSRYHSKKLALRIKAILEGIARKPYSG